MDRYGKKLDQARNKVIAEWGRGWDHLGVRLQQALLAEAVLDLAAAQDDDVSSDRVRELVLAGHSWVAGWGED
jgi:hypothetical protein